MQLSELELNRQLYKTQPQTAETLSADTVASNLAPPPSTAIASGNSVTDVNTNAETINGSQITPGTIPQPVLDIANWGWTQTCAFSVVDGDTVSWGSGNFKSADGTQNFSISAGSTGNMTLETYIYLDINVSTTAYQITTNILTPIGIGKVLIAVCKAGSPTATYNLVQATQIVSDNILANTIVAQKMNVAILSAITANLGTITAGTITGVLIRTATTGQRIEITSSPTNLISFYDTSTLYGSLEVLKSGTDGYINLLSQDGAGLSIYTGIGASAFGSATLSGQGGSVDVSGNASNSFAEFGELNGGVFGLHGGPSGAEIYSSDGGSGYIGISSDWFPTADGTYDLGQSGLAWNTVYAKTINGLLTLTIANGLTLTGTASFTRNSISQPTMYHGYCSGTTISKTNTAFTLTNPSTGNYTVSHSFSSSNYTVQVTALRASGSGAYTAKMAVLGTSSFDVIIFDDTGAAVNSDFMFLLLKN